MLLLLLVLPNPVSLQKYGCRREIPFHLHVGNPLYLRQNNKSKNISQVYPTVWDST